MCEKELSIYQVTAGVVSTANKLIEVKGVAPVSDHHVAAITNLVDMLANTPGAIEELRRRQNGG